MIQTARADGHTVLLLGQNSVKSHHKAAWNKGAKSVTNKSHAHARMTMLWTHSKSLHMKVRLCPPQDMLLRAVVLI